MVIVPVQKALQGSLAHGNAWITLLLWGNKVCSQMQSKQCSHFIFGCRHRLEPFFEGLFLAQSRPDLAGPPDLAPRVPLLSFWLKTWI